MPVGDWRRIADAAELGTLEYVSDGFVRWFCVDVMAPLGAHDMLRQQPGIPESRAPDPDWMPSADNSECPLGKCTMQHLYPHTDYWVNGAELEQAVKRGWVVTEVHSCIEARAEAAFAPFVELVKQGREDAKARRDDMAYTAIKLLGNAAVGQFATDTRKYHRTRVLYTPEDFLTVLRGRSSGTIVHDISEEESSDQPGVWRVEPSAETHTMPGYDDYVQRQMLQIALAAEGRCNSLSEQIANSLTSPGTVPTRDLLVELKREALCMLRAAEAMSSGAAVTAKAKALLSRHRADYSACGMDGFADFIDSGEDEMVAVKARKLKHPELFFLTRKLKDMSIRCTRLSVHGIRVDLRDIPQATDTLREWADNNYIELTPYLHLGRQMAHVLPRQTNAPPQRSWPVFQHVTALGRVALLDMCDALTQRGGQIMWYDTDGCCVILPRSACTGDDGPYISDSGDIGGIKHENKGRQIVRAYTPGIKSHALLYADGEEKLCAAGFPTHDQPSVEQFDRACRRADVTTLQWWSRGCKAKHISRSLGLTAAGGVLIGDVENNIPTSWLPFGHKDLETLDDNDEIDSSLDNRDWTSAAQQ
jgi:hypothetical protein